MSKWPKNNINYNILVIFFTHLPKLHDEETRKEQIMLKLKVTQRIIVCLMKMHIF